jgi:hypothetical protein
MEVNNISSIGSPHTPILFAGRGGVVPPPPPSPTRTNSNQTLTTSGSGTVPIMTMTTVPTIHNVYGDPFTYGMSGFDTSSTLTYSTLQTIGMGAGSLNAHLQGSFTDTTSPFNVIPYSGGHIPPISPSFGGALQ